MTNNPIDDRREPQGDDLARFVDDILQPDFAAMSDDELIAWIAADRARDPAAWAAIDAMNDDELRAIAAGGGP